MAEEQDRLLFKSRRLLKAMVSPEEWFRTLEIAGVAMEVSMNELAFKVLNGPVSILNLVAYVFFAFCLFCQRDGTDVLKQPLRALLVSLVTFMATIEIVTVVYVFYAFSHFYVMDFLLFGIECSFTTVVWLNVFYFSQIVPPQSTFSIWLKRNIKCTVYSVMIFDKFLFLADIPLILLWQYNINSTSTSSNTTTIQDFLVEPLAVLYFSRLVYFLLSLVVMMASSWATVSYLRRHLKNMESSRSPFTSSMHRQLRVTITGSLQAVLYFLCTTWFLLAHLLSNISHGRFDSNSYIFFTVMSMYCFGTAINVGVGQSLFRNRAVGWWHKVSDISILRRTSVTNA
ncbi:uncharacterized protein LOC116222916 [Clupea harengus]|uniref:Taste receptor type 2 n=1 Tax=Clupea harengus TaxID=7950 RepID=A0A6P8G228_CLUHA|nr:uncharacterized protein LOC116222916 [Clupea harengus]